ncbi:MAG: fused MFS/spermidine synthase, partial [Myxococcota bacterium]|nr:fused MFS/spermidine synthase [Myxococcota bacterium]
LVYEVVWMRWLALTFGVSTYAVSTVLATFMAGLAAGSYYFGGWIDRRRNPLMAYAVLELFIGVYALAVPGLFGVMRSFFVELHRLDLSSVEFALARALLAGLLLLPPTVLMGGTFPILVRFFVRHRREVGRSAGLLYFLNTLGATLGTLAAGFYFIEHLGLRQSNTLAASINFAVAAAAGLLAWTLRGAGPVASHADPPEENDPAPQAAEVKISTRVMWLALVCIGVSGFASLAYEVLWTRALTRYLYNSTYAFTTMLATFLSGIALGSAIYSAWLSRIRRPVLLFAVLQLCVGLGFLLSSFLFRDLSNLSTGLIGSVEVTSFGQSISTMFLRSAMILFLPTLFLGATLPLATDICTRGIDRLGFGLGRVYAVNTLGSILGALGASFVLIPLLGMQRSVVFLVILNFLMAGALGLAAARGPALRSGVLGASAALIGVAVYLVPGDLFTSTFKSADQSLVYYNEGATDTVGVIEYGPRNQRTIVYDDQRGTAGTNTVPWNFFFAHLPMLLHPGEPERILHICFGVGNSLAAVASYPSVTLVDNVELSPNAIRAAPYFWTNDDVLANPKVKTHIEDGRTFVLATEQTYDVILLEPPEIFTAGVVNIYTKEFYQDAASKLAPDGLLVQWLMVGQLPLEDEAMFFRALSDAFPYVTAWQQLANGPILLIGHKQPFEVDFAKVLEKMKRPNVLRDMKRIPLHGPEHLLSFFIFDTPAYLDHVRDVEPVTEDRTVVDFTAPRFAGSGYGFGLKVYGQKPPAWRGSVRWLTIRAVHYASKRVSVMPYVKNPANRTLELIESRIRLLQGNQPALEKALTEREWKRVRAQ